MKIRSLLLAALVGLFSTITSAAPDITKAQVCEQVTTETLANLSNPLAVNQIVAKYLALYPDWAATVIECAVKAAPALAPGIVTIAIQTLGEARAPEFTATAIQAAGPSDAVAITTAAIAASSVAQRSAIVASAVSVAPSLTTAFNNITAPSASGVDRGSFKPPGPPSGETNPGGQVLPDINVSPAGGGRGPP